MARHSSTCFFGRGIRPILVYTLASRKVIAEANLRISIPIVNYIFRSYHYINISFNFYSRLPSSVFIWCMFFID